MTLYPNDPSRAVVQQYFCFKCDEKYDAVEGIEAICPTCGTRGKCITNLREFLLADKRDFIIDKVKAPLMNTLVQLVNLIKVKPTVQNCKHPNSIVLLRIWDRFFKSEANPGREPMEHAMADGTVYMNEHDPYYRYRGDTLAEDWLTEVLEGNWKPRPPDQPLSHWRTDPNVRSIGADFIKAMYNNPEARESLKVLLAQVKTGKRWVD